MDSQIVLFDYAGLDSETRIVVRQRTDEIKTLIRRTAQDIIDIGNKLIEVKARLGHGNFGAWLNAEFGWSERAARNFIQVAETFKSANFADLSIASSALYLLAAPSTPEPARQEAIERAEQGETITHKEAKAMVETHKAPREEPMVEELWDEPLGDEYTEEEVDELQKRPAPKPIQRVKNPYDIPEHKIDTIRELKSRVAHGDAREWIKTIPSFDLLLTDPPYGVSFQSNRRIATEKAPVIANDNGIEGAINLLRDVMRSAYNTGKPDSTVMVFSSQRHEPEFRQAIIDAGFNWKGTYIWEKPNHGSGDLKGAFAPKHECIIHAVKGKPYLRNRPPSILKGSIFLEGPHPTRKPLDLLEVIIRATTDTGDIVIDPFAGSGSTIISAFRCERVCYTCELETDYYADLLVTIEREISNGF